jgi:predicted permease
MHGIWLRVRALWKRRQLERDLEDEVAFHLAMKAEKVDPQSARSQFGNPTATRETLRELWTFAPLETLAQDVRFAFRSFAKNRGFTLVAVLSLALGIGSTVAIFGMAHSILMRPMPVEEPDRLAAVFYTSPHWTGTGDFSYPELLDYRKEDTGLAELMGSSGVALRVTDSDRPELLWGQVVTGNFFSGLRLRMALGRGFQPEEDRAVGERPVAVISYRFWQRRFQGDPAVVGRSLPINGHILTIVGVAPFGFTGTQLFNYAPDVFVPLMMQPVILPNDGNYIEDRELHWVTVRGRLKPGISLDQGVAGMNVVARQLAAAYPKSNKDTTVHAIPGGTRTQPFLILSGAIPATVAIMSGAVTFLLLIAVVNVANLMLARSASRRKEIATRLAIGASRPRLIQQLLTEGLLLSLAGGLIGIGFARWLTLMLWRFYPTLDFVTVDMEYDQQTGLAVYGFALAVSAVAAVLFGLGPALRAASLDQATAMKEGSTGKPPNTHRLSKWPVLLTAQVALSCVLLVAGGLFLRSLVNAGNTNPGFDRTGLLLFTIDLDLQGYKKERGVSLQREITARLRQTPGVDSVSLAAPMPLGPDDAGFSVRIEGYIPNPNENLFSGRSSVGVDYFETVGTPLVAGRAFTPADDQTTRPVAIVNQTFARQYWGNPEAALGRHFGFARRTGWVEIVGIAKDGKYNMLGEPPTPFAFFPIAQEYNGRTSVILRTKQGLESVMEPVRKQVHSLDPQLPVLGPKTMPQYLERLMSIYQMGAAIVGAFALMALLLAAVGIFGVLHFSVAQRTREIGIRMALGAPPRSVVRLFLHRAFLVVLVGTAIGFAGAIAASRLLGSVVTGVSGTDPASFGSAALLILVVALLAAAAPARKAAAVDPGNTLRYE